MAPSAKIFVSYSHKDKRLFDEFQTMLAPAIRNGQVNMWADNAIPPGADWQQEIERALAQATVAVLLVSQNFLASRFIAKNELPPLLAAAKKKGVTIFWLYLSSCLFEHTEIAGYQAAHDTSRPLDRMPRAQRQAVLSEICAKLVRIADSNPQHLQPRPNDVPTRTVAKSGSARNPSIDAQFSVQTKDTLFRLLIKLARSVDQGDHDWTIEVEASCRETASDPFQELTTVRFEVDVRLNGAAELTATQGLDEAQLAYATVSMLHDLKAFARGELEDKEVERSVEKLLTARRK